MMKELFVERSIEINAPAAKVWEVLTNPALSREWISAWWPEIVALESNWQPDSPVVWKTTDSDGADGIVTIADPYRQLSFNFNVNGAGKQENITYRLEEHKGYTVLNVSVGNFGDTPEHEACYPGAVEAWEMSLPKIKELAEQ